MSEDLNLLCNNAIQAYQQGQYQYAESLFLNILNDFPNHPEVMHLLGIVYSQQSKNREAIEIIQQAIKINPNPKYYNSLGESFRRDKQLNKAVEVLREALNISPDFAEAYFNLANSLYEMGNTQEAISNYQKAIYLKPQYDKAFFNLGNIMIAENNSEAAKDYFEQALLINPSYTEAYNNLGVVLKNLKSNDAEQILFCFHKAINLSPGFGEAHHNYVDTIKEQGKISQAIEEYLKLIKQYPNNFLLYLFLASLKIEVDDLKTIIEIKQNSRKSLNYKSFNILYRFQLEILGPDIPLSSQEVDEYRDYLIKTLDNYQHENFKVDLSRLQNHRIEPPFCLYYHGKNNLEIKTKYAELFKNSFPSRESKKNKGKPHIGFVVTYENEPIFIKCMRGILNNISTEKFRITIVCSDNRSEKILKPHFSKPELNFLTIAKQFDVAVEDIANAVFDILYYWEIGTDNINYFLPFNRLAPIQCTSYGWPFTSGIPNIDYFISSELIESETNAKFYSEKLIRLKNLLTYYYKPAVPEILKSRQQLGLTGKEHIYLCIQNPLKIQPDFDKLISQILYKDPKGIIILRKDKFDHITEKLQRRLNTGYPELKDRIRFINPLSAEDFFSLMAISGVLLDTTGMGGANSTYDAFAVGAPVVTLPNELISSRYTQALYKKMGITEGIAVDEADYVNKAVKIANEPEYRHRISNKIKEFSIFIYNDISPVKELEELFESLLA